MNNSAYINEKGQLTINFNGEISIVRKTAKSSANYATVSVTSFSDGSFDAIPNRPNSSGIGKASEKAGGEVLYKRMVNKISGEKVYRECRTEEDLEIAKRQGEVSDNEVVLKKPAPRWFRIGGPVYYKQPKFEVHVLPINRGEN
ncbi:MAG: hypothetical protein CMF29_04885 [Kiritimatiellaceae bacterium]|nr:hypothetical protein [Kiritimatiellaceae bacterium]